MPLLQDPGLQAFLRIKEFQQAEIEADRVAALAELRAQREVASQQFSRDEAAGKLNINRGYEALGKYRSGGRHSALNVLVGDVNQRRMEADTGLAIASSQVNRESAANVTALDRQAEMERIAAAERIEQRRVQEAILQREQEQALYARQQYEAQIAFNQAERDKAQARASSSGGGGSSGGGSGGFLGSTAGTAPTNSAGHYNYDRYSVGIPKVSKPKTSVYKAPPAPTQGTTKGNTRYY